MLSIKTVSFYVLVVLFIAAVSAGIALLVTQNRSGSLGVEIMLPTITPTPELKVHISGAVAAPGVYKMREGDRLEDTIDGGYVNRCVNDIRRRPSQPLIQWRFHPHTVHRDRRLRSTQGPSDA